MKMKKKLKILEMKKKNLILKNKIFVIKSLKNLKKI